jgi:Protein of unknown function (DUF2026)
MPARFAITLAEFNRVYQVIHGTIRGEARAEKACVFFALVGSWILNQKLGILAQPVAGGFIFRPTEEERLVCYGKADGRQFSWGDDGFHVWVETEHHLIDFLSPIYREAFAEAEEPLSLPRKMFQKRRSEEKSAINSLMQRGDFITFPDPQLTLEIMEQFVSVPANSDLLEIAQTWYGTPKSKLRSSIHMQSNDGVLHQLTLPSTIATGAW